MDSLTEKKAGKHFVQLDSLRGLAAGAVVLHHWNIIWGLSGAPKLGQAALQIFPLKLLTTGHSSVVMFFVLSGFVLSLPQVRGRKVDQGGGGKGKDGIVL